MEGGVGEEGKEKEMSHVAGMLHQEMQFYGHLMNTYR